jgi:outer membrane protein assembly factor BamD
MRNILHISLILILLSSCSKYQKVLKSDNYNYKYEKAVMYYDNGDYNRAMPLFNELSTVFKGTSKIQQVSYYYAYCNYSTGDNLSAAYLFRNYTINFPNSKHTEECAYMVAFCFYNEAPVFSLDATNTKRAIKELQSFADSYPNSKHTEECAYMVAFCFYNEAPVFSLDATNTKRAIKELQSFADSYPNSERLVKCNELIDELQFKLSEKDFENAKQYYITSNYKSAIIALDNVLIDFPSFNNREEVHFLIVKSTYLLAVNSISIKVKERLEATIEAYAHFKDNYPQSNYLKELENTYDKTKLILSELKQKSDEI